MQSALNSTIQDYPSPYYIIAMEGHEAPAPQAPVPSNLSTSPPTTSPPHRNHAGTRHPIIWIIAGVAVLCVVVAIVHWFIKSLGTVSTDDAYVNGHVTFVA